MSEMESSRQWQQHNGVVLDHVNEFDVIECGPCGYKHIVPIPTQDELEQVYREDYYSQEKPLYLEEHQEDLDWWNLVYDERYDYLESHLSGESRRILDVGSGPGYFLLRGKSRGWEAVGIEPSKHASAHSRELGLDIRSGFLCEDMVESLGMFDVVYLHEVLEHIPHPASLLSIITQVLKPGGILCVIVPNDYNPLQRALRTTMNFEPWWLAPPHHINYFDHASLLSLLEKQGFDILFRSSTFPIELFLLMGMNYVGDSTVGRMVHGQRKTMEMNLAKIGCAELKRTTYQTFAHQGMGREAVIYARLP